MSSIDVAIIVTYLLGTMLIGFLARGKDKNAEDFFRDTAAVELLGRILGVGDASINLQTALTALSRMESG